MREYDDPKYIVAYMGVLEGTPSARDGWPELIVRPYVEREKLLDKCAELMELGTPYKVFETAPLDVLGGEITAHIKRRVDEDREREEARLEKRLAELRGSR